MSPQSAAWLGALLGWIVSGALSGVLAWCGPVDRPRARGLHATPTPTSGGLAILGGTAAALILGVPALSSASGVDLAFTAAIAVAVAHGLLGGLDDVVDFGAKVKLAVQLALALGFALVVHPARLALTPSLGLDLPWLVSVPGTALWLIVTVNAVNFMDGSNGLIAGALAIVLGGLGLRALGGDDAALSLALLAAAGACLGFLPWNYPKARLFQGDAGALFLGALVATLAVVAAGAGRTPGALQLLSVPIALTPLLIDVLLTLVARARRKAPLLEAHREHLYQRWLAARGGDHAALARRLWLITGLYTLAAMSVAEGDPLLAVLAFVIGVAIAVAGWLWVDRGLRRSG